MNAILRFWVAVIALLLIGLWNWFEGDDWIGGAFTLSALLLLALGKPRD